MRKIINKKEFITNYLSGMRLKEMASLYGVSDTMIRYYARKLGLPGRSRGNRKIIFEDKKDV
jgi:transposase